MSDTHTDLVIQISTAEPESRTTAPAARMSEGSRLITELRTCLQPGVEIALVFEGYMARTSILWLSDLQADGSVRAGVRLLGVSALPADKAAASSDWDEVSQRAVPVSMASTIIRQHV